jgi:hypothetical protein
MKTFIYWFSGTGNSLAVAKALADQCGDIELVPMAKAIKNPPPPAARIGRVFPVYSFGPPALVARFTETLNALPDACIFAVVTCAGNKGGTLAVLKNRLQRRGLQLAAGWSVKMPDNYPPFGSAPAPEKQQTIQAAASARIKWIAAELKQLPDGQSEKTGAIGRLLSSMVYPLFQRFLPRADRFFRVDEKCNGSGSRAVWAFIKTASLPSPAVS